MADLIPERCNACPKSFHFHFNAICCCFALPCYSTVCGFAPNLALKWKRNHGSRLAGLDDEADET